MVVKVEKARRRRGRLRSWAALLSALLRHRLARRARAALLFVTRRGRRGGELRGGAHAASPGDDEDTGGRGSPSEHCEFGEARGTITALDPSSGGDLGDPASPNCTPKATLVADHGDDELGRTGDKSGDEDRDRGEEQRRGERSQTGDHTCFPEKKEDSRHEPATILAALGAPPRAVNPSAAEQEDSGRASSASARQLFPEGVEGRNVGSRSDQEGVEGRDNENAAGAIATPCSELPAHPTNTLIPEEDNRKSENKKMPRLPLANHAAENVGVESHERGEGNGADATPGAHSVAQGPCYDTVGERTPASALGSNGVQLQSDGIAVAVTGGSDKATSPHAARHRPFVARNKKAKAKPKAQPLLQAYQWEEDEDIIEDSDLEMRKHEAYRDKICRKTGYMYCLICHLNNKETELPKDTDKVKHHCKKVHQCDNKGGIKCKKDGCLVRAKNNRDIGLHQYVCRRM